MELITLPLGALQTNCYFVIDEETSVCAVVDPGDEAEKIEAELAGRGLTCKAILLTHAHFDHTGALRALHAAHPELPIWVSALDTDEMLNMSQGNLVYTETFSDGDEISCGPLSFRVIATPGHTQGSSCFVCGDVLLAGDTLFAGTCGRTDLPGSSNEQMMASLKRLAELPGDYRVLPGHGRSSTLERERQTNFYMREALRV